MSISQKIATFVLNTNIDSIDAKAIENAKRAFLDSLGVMIAGSKTDTSGLYLRYLRAIGAKGSYRVQLGSVSIDLPILEASSLYAIWLHALDYDDTGAFSQGHPSSTVFPVIYTLLTDEDVSCSDILVAYAIGVEVLSRFSRAMPMMHLKGWHPTGTIGTIAATVTAAKLLRLSDEEIQNAIGIAASSASGMVQNFGTMTKPLHAANAVYNGLKAAVLAREGFTSNKDAIDGNLGFLNTYYGNGNKMNEYLKDIQGELVIANPGINFKRHASCALTHRSIDAVLKIMEENKLDSRQIQRIQCFTSPRALKVLFYDNPVSELEAKFSMHYVLAVAAIKGDLTPKQFSASNLNSVEIRQLMKNVELKVHEDWEDGNDWRADRVVIELDNKESYETSIQFPKGNVAIPLTWEELVLKFKGCCDEIISGSQSELIINWVKDMEQQTHVYKFDEL